MSCLKRMEKVRRRNFFNKRGSAEIALVFKIEKVGISFSFNNNKFYYNVKCYYIRIHNALFSLIYLFIYICISEKLPPPLRDDERFLKQRPSRL